MRARLAAPAPDVRCAVFVCRGRNGPQAASMPIRRGSLQPPGEGEGEVPGGCATRYGSTVKAVKGQCRRERAGPHHQVSGRWPANGRPICPAAIGYDRRRKLPADRAMVTRRSWRGDNPGAGCRLRHGRAFTAVRLKAATRCTAAGGGAPWRRYACATGRRCGALRPYSPRRHGPSSGRLARSVARQSSGISRTGLACSRRSSACLRGRP